MRYTGYFKRMLELASYYRKSSKIWNVAASMWQVDYIRWECFQAS